MNALATLTVSHVLVSLVGLGAGFVVIWGLLNGKRLDRSTALFLVTTISTSASGFLFPADRVTPAHVLGVLSLGLLAVAGLARYYGKLAGWWRPTYIVSAVTAQYLNFFVLVVQLFLKVPALQALAPTQTEPAFAIAQSITLAVFVAVGIVAAFRFRVGSDTRRVPNYSVFSGRSRKSVVSADRTAGTSS
jgi:hypothetical protein